LSLLEIRLHISTLDSLGPALNPDELDKQIDPLDNEVTHYGVIRKILTEKQYGFVQIEDGSDLFFMLNDVQEPWVVAVGDQVTYRVQSDDSHNGKSRAVRIIPSMLARPSCHSPGGSVLRQTNALRSSMVRMTISAKPASPAKTAEDWQAGIDTATKKFRRYLVKFAGMDDEEAIEFGNIKIAKAMKSEDISNLPKHLQAIVEGKRGLEQCETEDNAFADKILDRAEYSLRASGTMMRISQLETVSETVSEARPVIDSSRMAVANRFHQGEIHSGEVFQLVRGKFGFIVAESDKHKELKQKLFFFLKDAPEGICLGDKVKFVVGQDPYSSDKMIATDVTIAERAKPKAAEYKRLPLQRAKQTEVEVSNHRASMDKCWRRGGPATVTATSTSNGGAWASYNRSRQQRDHDGYRRN